MSEMTGEICVSLPSSAVCSASARSQQESELLIQECDVGTKDVEKDEVEKVNRTIKHFEVINSDLLKYCRHVCKTSRNVWPTLHRVIAHDTRV